MAWIESHQELANHPKTKRFKRSLGISTPQAIGHLHLLWWWALDYAQDGSLVGFTPDDIAEAAEYEGEGERFLDALTVSGFVDADSLTIHDWEDYGGRFLKRRELARVRQQRHRSADSRESQGSNALVNEGHALVTRDMSVSHAATRQDKTEQDRRGEEKTSSAPSREPYTREFEEFWKTYPRTNGTKLEAFAAWKTLKLEERGPALAGLPKWKESHHWAVEGKIVYAERYLKRRMWKDDPAPPPEPRVRLLTSPSQHDEAMVAWMQLVREVANPGSEFPDRRLPRRIYDAAMAVGGPKAIDPAKPFQCKTFCDAYRAWTEVAS